jgi:hypothetical protein
MDLAIVEAVIISLTITAIVYYSVCGFVKYSELRQLKKDLDSYYFVVQIEKSLYLDESFRFRDLNLPFIARQIKLNHYCGNNTYIRSDVAKKYKEKGILNYSEQQKVYTKDFISDYARFKHHIPKLPKYEYYLIYKPLSDLKEYFEDVDKPTQDEINYVKMVLPEKEQKYYKELD